ncbi:hypothetical protein F900_01908 [Acinetobacter modestus]|uniref:Uncharacterized protein n=1 Tax=Acinetobacter modestus TaxID=1776740 RepID=N9LXD2_9GAMM|nr:hypothetical protein [Acinetobacter modestus]ENX00924.1 hypothetical protein F900_01908 [Acinetobacter modestus]
MSFYENKDWQCRRCRWAGQHNQLVAGKYDRKTGTTANVCPRCSCSVFNLIDKKEK